MEKAIKKYSEIYKKVLSAAGIENSGQNIDAYKKRLGEVSSRHREFGAKYRCL